MKLYKYDKYEDYVAAQIKANKRKITKIWVKETTIKTIVNTQPDANKILCHGTRNGKEQELFIKYLPNAEIIGTEISETALQFKNTVQHDFHESKREWINKFDIIYSNSWDHSYDPKKSLTTWRNQLNDNGKLYIEHAIDPKDNKSRESDPLEIFHDEILLLFIETGLTLVNTFNSVSCDEHPCKIYISKKG